MKPWKIIASIVPLFILTSFTHPFHASITQGNYNEQTKSLEITMRLFTDDLEVAIQKDLNNKKLISHPKDSALARYLKQNFLLQTEEGLKLQPIYLGRDTDFDLTFVFFEIPSFPLKREYKVSQTVFFDMFDDQSNIVNITIGKKSGAAYFTPAQTMKTLVVE